MIHPRVELPATLLAVFVAIWLALAVSPISREDWLLENLLVLISIPALVATRQRMTFSNASYLCLFVFFLLHSVGAHYTYSLVPYDRWWELLSGNSLNELFGWQRNHYDRLVHFLYGVLVLPPSASCSILCAVAWRVASARYCRSVRHVSLRHLRDRRVGCGPDRRAGAR